MAANDYCKNIGGYLATITSQGEQDFVASLAARVDYSDFWIGGSDYGSEGNGTGSTVSRGIIRHGTLAVLPEIPSRTTVSVPEKITSL